MMQLERYYQNVLDLPSVDGLLVIRRNGEVAYDRLPGFIPRETLDDIVRRIASLYDTVDENFLPCDDYVLKYPEKWLVFRRNKEAILMLMVEPEINFISLKMVCNLALKNTDAAGLKSLPRIGDATPAPSPRSPSVSPTPTPIPQAPPAAPAAETEVPAPSEEAPVRRVVAKRPVRSYRGTSY